MVMISGPTRISLTRSRRIRWRSGVPELLGVAAHRLEDTFDPVASYRDGLRLLHNFVHETTGTQPSKLRLEDIDAPA